MFPSPFRRPQRHIAGTVLHDLITAVLVALAAVIASGLLDRIWDALLSTGEPTGFSRPSLKRIRRCVCRPRRVSKARQARWSRATISA
jgi:hypothetical protein